MAYGIEAARIFLQYVLPVLLVAASAALIVFCLGRMKRLHGTVVRSEEQLKSATATWMRTITVMGKEIESIKEAAKYPPADSGASATRRKVLKMHRLGSSVEQIAQALRLSKGEVMLLLKVHTIILRPLECGVGEQQSADTEQKS